MTCEHRPAQKGFKGVCAFCLCERLSALRAASGEAKESPESDPAPPSSSAPAIARSPSASVAHPLSHSAPLPVPAHQNQQRGRRSSFWRLLRRSRPTGNDSQPQPPPSSASKTARIASSWVCAFRRRKKKKSRLFSVDDEIPAAGIRKPEKTTIDRGLSPVSSPEASPDLQEGLGRPAAGEVTKKARKHRQISKLSVCFSPLVRASHRHDRFFSCKAREGNRHGQWTEPTLGPNRSKKIADFGKKQ